MIFLYYGSYLLLILCLLFPHTLLLTLGAGIFIEDLAAAMFIFISLSLVLGSYLLSDLIRRDKVKAFKNILRLKRSFTKAAKSWWLCKLLLTIVLMYFCGFIYTPLVYVAGIYYFHRNSKKIIKEFNQNHS